MHKNFSLLSLEKRLYKTLILIKALKEIFEKPIIGLCALEPEDWPDIAELLIKIKKEVDFHLNFPHDMSKMKQAISECLNLS